MSVHLYRGEIRRLSEDLAAREAEIASLRSANAALEKERDEFKAKGERLCCVHGNALIELHDVKAERDDAVAHWREAEAQAKSESSGCMLCGDCTSQQPATWVPRLKAYRCAACEEAHR